MLRNNFLIRSVLRSQVRTCCGSVLYKDVYKKSIEHPERFWAEQAKELKWSEPWKEILDSKSSSPASLWFPGGKMNVCENALDFQIQQGRGDQAAIIFESNYTGTKFSLSYTQLLDEVSRFSDVLSKQGIGYNPDSDDQQTVVIYMANSVEAVIAMLACARRGVPHSVVFGGFAAQELAKRIKHVKPSIIIASSCGIEPKRIIEYKPLLDDALKLADCEDTKTIIFQRPECKAKMITGRDFDWEELMKTAGNSPPVQVPSNHPLYILYTSGTTGQPKGIVRDSAGYATALKWSMPNVYGMKPGDVFWAASDVGWVVGHSYIAYAPLLSGCTSLIFEGKPVGTPDAGAFWKIIQDYHVKALFCAPTAFRAIKREDPKGEYMKGYDLSHFKALFLAGERADPDTIKWAENLLPGRPVIDNYWQTETGWPVASNFIGKFQQPTKAGSSSFPIPGYNIKILSKEGKEQEAEKLGNICIKPPLPPGCMTSLFKNKKGMKETYFEPFDEFYNTGDSGYFDKDGYLFIMTRTGDIINVAGHRLSTGGLEEALSGHHEVAECAVIGIKDSVKGQTPLGIIVLSSQISKDEEEIKKECVQRVRSIVGPVAAFHQVLVVDRLPKTRSGKILRRILQSMADEEPWSAPATTEDASVFPEIEERMKRAGIIQNKE